MAQLEQSQKETRFLAETWFLFASLASAGATAAAGAAMA
jgi:hypothetical protein